MPGSWSGRRNSSVRFQGLAGTCWFFLWDFASHPSLAPIITLLTLWIHYQIKPLFWKQWPTIFYHHYHLTDHTLLEDVVNPCFHAQNTQRQWNSKCISETSTPLHSNGLILCHSFHLSSCKINACTSDTFPASIQRADSWRPLFKREMCPFVFENKAVLPNSQSLSIFLKR